MYTQLLNLGIETKSLGSKSTFHMCLLPENGTFLGSTHPSWEGDLPGKAIPFLGRGPSWETPHLPGKGTFLGTPHPSWNAHHPGKDPPSWSSHPRKGRCFLGPPLPRKGLPFPGRLPPFPDVRGEGKKQKVCDPARAMPRRATRLATFFTQAICLPGSPTKALSCFGLGRNQTERV